MYGGRTAGLSQTAAIPNAKASIPNGWLQVNNRLRMERQAWVDCSPPSWWHEWRYRSLLSSVPHHQISVGPRLQRGEQLA
ncbi:MAG TPA: hypothetical protein VIG85_02300 [Comamonas sp.]